MVKETSRRATIAATKTVSFPYFSSEELALLFEGFGGMCNEALRIAIREAPTSRFHLIELAYDRLKTYGLHSHYVLSACEIAYSIYKKKKGKSIPVIRRPFIKLDNQSYQLNHLLLRIPTGPRKYIFIILYDSDYHLAFIDNPTLKRGSVTITPGTVNITFSKETQAFEPLGSMGIDTNEKNVTVSATDGYCCQFREIGEVVEIKENYREIRARISRMIGDDRRVAKDLLAKYGKRERNRTVTRVHNITKQITGYAKEHHYNIKMEKLTGIRKLYRKGNGQGKSFRGRMNTWVFGMFQRQVMYKAEWEGIPTYLINPRGTSQKCPDCGSRVVRLAGRRLFCPTCDNTWDRDVLASRNVMACVVPQVRPSRGSDEGERDDDGSNPPSRWREGVTNWSLQAKGFPEP